MRKYKTNVRLNSSHTMRIENANSRKLEWRRSNIIRAWEWKRVDLLSTKNKWTIDKWRGCGTSNRMNKKKQQLNLTSGHSRPLPFFNFIRIHANFDAHFIVCKANNSQNHVLTRKWKRIGGVSRSAPSLKKCIRNREIKCCSMEFDIFFLFVCGCAFVFACNFGRL